MIQDIHKIIVKLIPQDIPNPKGVKPEDVVIVFNKWIQNASVAGHKLIDVANYSHVLDGPGVVLVGLEANFQLENAATGRYFAYQRKAPLGGDFAARLRYCVEAARKAGELLERNLPIRFRTDRFEIQFADRLNAPATEETYGAVGNVLAPYLASLGNAEFEVIREKEGLTRVLIKTVEEVIVE